jgi:hypothetical protein
VTVHLTVPGVLEAMTAAVNARGRDYVYKPPENPDSCLYVHDGCPSCLIGDTLHRCGVPLEALAEHEGASARSLLRDLEALGLVTCEAGVTSALGAAQLVQDGSNGRGRTWGEALDVAVVATRAVAS